MPGGRPLGLTVARRDALLDAIRTGATERRSAAFAGISLETVRAWRRKGEAAADIPAGKRSQSQRLYFEFVLSLDEALATTAIRMQTIVTQIAFNGQARAGATVTIEQQRLSLQAATWWLSHRERQDYTLRTEVTGPDGGPIEMTADEAFANLLGLVADPPDEREDDDDGA
jgi:hypothetical protein